MFFFFSVYEPSDNTIKKDIMTSQADKPHQAPLNEWSRFSDYVLFFSAF